MNPKTRILINMEAGRGRAERLPAVLRSRSDLEWVTPDGAEATADEARRAAGEGLERLLVVGGDGTLHHAIQGLAGTDTALGVVPAGTGNDLARALGLSLDPILAFEQACHGPIRNIDLGRLDGKPFAGVAAIGFDSEVLSFMRRKPGGFGGPLAYGYAVLRTLLTFKSPALRIDAPQASHDGPALLAVVANSPMFGGGMRIAPQAELDDGWLDLVIIEPLSLLRSLVLFPRVYRGTHIDHPAVSCHRVRQATLSCDRPITVNGDGEPLARAGKTGALVEIWPGALRVVA